MTISIHNASVTIAGSTAAAYGALPVGASKYIEVTNASTALAYVNAGTSLAAVGTSNVPVGANSTVLFERDPNADNYGAVILSSGSGTVVMTLSGV